jgi:hypothetical protein
MPIQKLLTTIAAIACFTACSVFAADGLTLNVGTDYSSGKYGGTDRTTVWSVPISAKYVAGPVAFRLVTSWLQVSGTGVVVPSGLGGIGDGSGASGAGSGGSSAGTQGVFGCAADNRGGARKPEDNGPCATTTTTTTGGTTTTAAARRTESGIGDVVASVMSIRPSTATA